MGKIVSCVPDWLAKVPKGEYSITELMALTKQSYQNIYIKLNILGLDRRYKRTIGSNYRVVVYAWLGVDKYKHLDLKNKRRELND